METVTILPAIVTALREAGPWLAFAAGAVTLYIMQVKRTEKIEKRLEEREDAFRKLAISLAGVNAKNLTTLDSIKDVLIRNQAALDKSEARHESFDDRIKALDTKFDGMSGRLIEPCTHVQRGR